MAWHLSQQEFLNKFEVVPAIINDWMKDFGGLRNKAILDFGCGEGLQAAGIANGYAPSIMYGVDLFEENKLLKDILTQYGGEIDCPLPTFETIKAGAVVPFRSVDFIYSWSVFEHVDLDIYDSVVADLHSALNDKGHLLIQIAPLYFSPEGGHLWAAGYTEWEHLTKQLNFILKDLRALPITAEATNQIWSMFIALNRITSAEMMSRIQAGGFKLLRKFESVTEKTPPAHLLKAYSEEALKTNQVVALFEKS